MNQNNMSNMLCPMCGYPLHYELIGGEQIITKEVDKGTHFYTCDECPFVGFEFYQNVNALDAMRRLTK